MLEETTERLRRLFAALRWTRSSYFLMSAFAATLFVIVVVWWPLVVENLGYIDPARPLWAQMDWRPDADSDQGPPRAHHLTPEQVMAWLRAAGFASARQTWQDADSYLVEATLKLALRSSLYDRKDKRPCAAL